MKAMVRHTSHSDPWKQRVGNDSFLLQQPGMLIRATLHAFCPRKTADGHMMKVRDDLFDGMLSITMY